MSHSDWYFVFGTPEATRLLLLKQVFAKSEPWKLLRPRDFAQTKSLIDKRSTVHNFIVRIESSQGASCVLTQELKFEVTSTRVFFEIFFIVSTSLRHFKHSNSRTSCVQWLLIVAAGRVMCLLLEGGRIMNNWWAIVEKKTLRSPWNYLLDWSIYSCCVGAALETLVHLSTLCLEGRSQLSLHFLLPRTWSGRSLNFLSVITERDSSVLHDNRHEPQVIFFSFRVWSCFLKESFLF